MNDSPPFLHVLNFSGGAQSSYLLEMLLTGEMEIPLRMVVVISDPGMEQTHSWWNICDYRKRCRDKGIDIIVAQGPSLFNDLVSMPSTGSRRMDNPPFWTKNADGSRGRLRQKCTEFYKIAPMDRAVRQYLKNKHGIGAGKGLRPGLVEKWIGFASDEWHRCSESDVAYVRFRYPMIEAGISKSDVDAFFTAKGHKISRSVCSACPWNGLAFFKDMYEKRPENWRQAVEVDDSLEAWPSIGICDSKPFVSSSLVRLRDLPAMNFGVEDPDMSEHHCNSGVCFL